MAIRYGIIDRAIQRDALFTGDSDASKRNWVTYGALPKLGEKQLR